MDTSYVAVGTVMSMITDSLTCRPQKSPAERGAAAALVPPAIHAARHERAGRAFARRDRLYRWRPLSSSQRLRHLTRSRPQDSASNTAAPQWEPRKPLGGVRKPRRKGGAPAGPKWGGVVKIGPL